MPLVAAEMKAKFRKRIKDGLKRVYSPNPAPGVDANWDKMADAISDIAMDIVTELTTNASVAPGIPVVGAGPTGPVSGTTVAPGHII
jgi:hypothetical protein